ncbi:MAG TPA: hypothetical protein VMH82_11820 [Myxococcota bacterium]|nr:hypothetical protein [Myxococcota bacterium]
MSKFWVTASALSLLFFVALGPNRAQAGPASNGLVIADFNGDGWDDILFRDTTDGFVGWWYLNGTNVGTANPVIVDGFGVPDPGPGFTLLGAGYFNNDKDADVLWLENATGNLIIWFMGDKMISSATNLGNPGAGLTVAGIGDIDHNGNSDIIFRQGAGATATVAAWLIENGAVLSGTSIGTIDSNWVVTALGNVDNAGGDDILFRNTTDGFVGWWTLDASKSPVIQNGAGVPDPGADFTIKGFADVNQDKKADVIWKQISTSDVVYWLMNSDLTIASAPNIGAGPAGFDVGGIGDIDGNGAADVLFRDSGTVATWLINNAAFLNGASVGSIPSQWVISNPNGGP